MKASTVYILLVIACLALLRFSAPPSKSIFGRDRRNRLGRRLILKAQTNASETKHQHVSFDPIVAEFERKREDRAWEREYFAQKYKEWGEMAASNNNSTSQPQDQNEEPASWDDDYGDEDYLNDENQFNISHRLTVLFPLIDVNYDQFISLEELQGWHVKLAINDAVHRTKREWELYDKNRDNMISFREYLPTFSEEEIAKGSMEHGGAGWFKEQFDAADEDGDNSLNETEFHNFLHPEDSNSTKLHRWLRMQEIKDRDDDKDGRISFTEFDQHLHDIIRKHGVYMGNQVDADEDKGKREISSKERFSELDKNKDGFLTEEELEPIMDELHPGELFYAKQQAEYLIQQADDNKDGRLSLQEMLEHPYVFYSTAYSQDVPDYSHDEFR